MRYSEILEACWTGYRQAGMKKKGDRQVPNCVPVSEQDMEEDLKKWFKEKWVRFGPDGKIRGSCARGSESEGKPKCLPQAKAHALGKKGRASAAAKKRREDPNPERRGPARNVATRVRESAPDLNTAAAEMMKRYPPKNPNTRWTNDTLEYWLTNVYGTGTASYLINAGITDVLNRMIQQKTKAPTNKPKTSGVFQQIKDFGNLVKNTLGPEPRRESVEQVKEQNTEDNDWYDDADEFGMPGSEFFSDDDRLRDGDYVRDRQDGEHGEIFRMSGDPSERRVRILDRDGKGWYISPERLVAVDRTDPDIMKYFGKKRRQDIDEKQDACYRKVKSRYKVWPSAYASGALVQCRKKGAANWGTGGKKK